MKRTRATIGMLVGFVQLVKAILPIVIGVALLGGGAIWVGLKIWSKLESIRINKNAEKPPIENRLVVATIAPPTPSQLPPVIQTEELLADAIESAGADGVRLFITSDRGVLYLHIPAPCDLYASGDGITWTYGMTFYEPEILIVSPDASMALFRALPIRSPDKTE